MLFWIKEKQLILKASGDFMQPKQYINLLVLALFSVSSACFFPKKASAEIVQTSLGNTPIACETDTQECYTPQNGGWAYVGSISEISNLQATIELCRKAYLGDPWSAHFTESWDCGRYGYPRNQSAERGSQSIDKSLRELGETVDSILGL